MSRLAIFIFSLVIFGGAFETYAIELPQDCEARLALPGVDEWMQFAQAYPHEFTIQYPPRREYFQEKFTAPPVTVTPDPTRPWLLYVHVPFCEKKCYFCNFAVDVRHENEIYDAYVSALEAELRRNEVYIGPKGIGGIDIGGGTPTRLPVAHLERLLKAIRPYQQAADHPFHTSIETTPTIAADESEKLILLAENGVRRVSMGVQSFNEQQLAAVNRTLHQDKNEKAAENIHALHFLRFNVDLIFGLPDQSPEQWREDLRRVVGLKPDSITIYDCLYRGKGRALSKRAKSLPTMEEYGRLYDIAYDYLVSEGFRAPYGSVNFSKHAGDRGTSAYFEGRLLSGDPYLGTGNYSSSWIDDKWFFNLRGVNEYNARMRADASVVGDFYLLPPAELYAKYILYSLNYGIIDERRFENRFGVRFAEVFAPELARAQAAGWIAKEGDEWRIPYGQFKTLNYLRSLFYSPSARRWLRDLDK